MYLKKYYKTIIIVCTLILAFDISYYMSFTSLFPKRNINSSKKSKVPDVKYDNISDNISQNDEETPVNSYTDNDETVSESAKIIYKIKYTNTDDFVVENVEDAKYLAGMKKKDIQKVYADKGYYVESMNEDEIVCIKEAERYVYEKGKYVIGINNAYPAVYKISDEGKMIFIENSANLFGSKAKKMSDFSKPFCDELIYGDKEIQFDTLDEVENILSADNS